jgi:hypothetical protein
MLPVVPHLHETVRERDQTEQVDGKDKHRFVSLFPTEFSAVAFSKNSKLYIFDCRTVRRRKRIASLLGLGTELCSHTFRTY